jgi:hypothetical protein
VLQSLLEETDDLTALAEQVQTADAATGNSAARELERRYRGWFAQACASLPVNLQARFRFEYDGNWAQTRIKQFLKKPREPRTQIPGMSPEFQTLMSPWQNPYTDAFIGPFLEQRQILEEALHQTHSSPTIDALDHLEAMFRRLHVAAAVLSRPTHGHAEYVISNEYGLQSLVHALLTLFYDDVREEEHTPSRAGGAARIDFLLKKPGVLVETKHTRPTLGKRQLGDELAADILRYRAHPDARALCALIYDPERRVSNPTGFEDDLKDDSAGFPIRVIVTPHQ